MKLTCGISVGGKTLTFAISQTPGGELCCCLQECCGLGIDAAVAFLHDLEQATSAPAAPAPEPPAPEPAAAPAKRGRKPAAPAAEAEPAPAAAKDDRQTAMFSSGEKPKPAPKEEPEAEATPAPAIPLGDEQLVKRYADCANIRSVVNRAAVELGDTATQEKINRVVLKLQKAGHPALQREDLMDKVKQQAIGLGIEE